MYRGASNRDRGAALLLVISLLGAMSIFLAAYFESIHAQLDRTRNQLGALAAGNLAEAGIEKVIAELLAGATDYAGESGTPLARGTFTVRVSRDAPGEYTIESTGRVKDGGAVLHERTLHVAITIRNGRLISQRYTSFNAGS